MPPLRRSTCGGRRETRVPKTAGRLIREVVYGIQSRGSVRLSEIARSLEEGTSLKKIIDRLSRQLSRGGLRERVRENLPRLAAGRIGEEASPSFASMPWPTALSRSSSHGPPSSNQFHLPRTLRPYCFRC